MMHKLLIALIVLKALINITYARENADSLGNLVVSIKKLRNNNGMMRVSLFSSKDGFPGQSEKAFKVMTADIENKETVTIFSHLPYGVYAIAILHDENSNRKMDTWLGLPKEGYGASNDARGVFGPPSFEDATFELNDDSLFIEIKAQYLGSF